MEAYRLENIKYQDELFPEIDATYIIHLEGNGRYPRIQEQLAKYHPTKEVFILWNQGYKRCKKSAHITNPPLDLVDAFLHVCEDAKSRNYNYVLILEDDFLFDDQVLSTTHRQNIQQFLAGRENENFQYILGCIPYIRIPYTWTTDLSILSAGMHACIYSKPNREYLLADRYNIKDWDIYGLGRVRRYMYWTPLCYQLFPKTENSEHWGYENVIIYLLAIFMRSLFALLRLDTQIEPGYSIFYFLSFFLFWILLGTSMIAIMFTANYFATFPNIQLL
jgi:hypothetical protein